MNCLSRASSYVAAILGQRNLFIVSSILHQCSTPSLTRGFDRAGVPTVDLKFFLTRFHVQCYSSKKASVKSSRVKAFRKQKSVHVPRVMGEEKDAFFVVRKGDVVGVYKSLTDCQAQVGSSICDPPVSIYKGYSLPKDTKDYLVSRGLQNALYTIRATDLKEDLFGALVPCPFQYPTFSKGETSTMDVTKKRSIEAQDVGTDGSAYLLADPLRKYVKLDNQADIQALAYDPSSCVLEFDGASKGNPGPAGAGAVLRTADGSLICRLREGLGKTTNNVAEYRAMILGLKYALQKGYTKIRVQGDSKLVCSQIQGLWKVRHQNLTDLYDQAKKLKDRFISFQINHVLREFNSDADAQANLAVNLPGGQIQEEFEQ